MTTPALTPAQKANATLGALQSLTLNGAAVTAQVAQVIQDVKYERTIEGVNTLTLDLYDDATKLLRSGIFMNRNSMRFGGLDFLTVQVRKNGPSMTLTFEDWVVAELRRKNTPFKVAPNTTNHVAFAQRLVREVPTVGFFHPPGTVPKSKAPTELSRGNPADKAAEKETSWAALQRMADERGWRCFTRRKTVLYAPETWLIGQPATHRFTENYQGVEYIDFDLDIGKPVATMKMRVRMAREDLEVGNNVEIYNMGPVNGKWLISSISRSIFDLHADVTLTKARPTLPEPKPEPVSKASSAGSSGDAGGSYDGPRRSYGTLGGVKPHVRAAAEEVGGKHGITTIGGVGYRPNKSDHPTGYALDFMCSPQQGDAIAEYLYDNAARLKIKYIIWKQRIRYPGGEWRRMADRGGATANHEDHVHASFNP